MPTILPVEVPQVNVAPPPDLAPIEGPPVPPGTLVSDPPPASPDPPAPTPVVVGQPSENPPTPVDPLAISRQALGDAAAANKDQQRAAVDEAKAQQEKNEADAKAAEAQAAQIRKHQEDADREHQASEQARARLVQIADQADNDVGHFKFTDYKDTIPITSKLKLAIGGALAGLGGGDPLEQINKNIERHFATQKAELSSKEALAKYRRQGIDDHDKHVNDQRLYLGFQERNYREAMAKEAEANGLRSGNPLALARAQQLAAKIRAEGDAKLVNMADQYIAGEERRAHAQLLKSKARGAGAGAGGGAGLDRVEEELAQAAQDGKPYADLVKIAIKLKTKDPRKAAKEAIEGVEKDQKTIVHDPDTGKPLGRAASARNVGQIAADLANGRAYVSKVEKLADHIEKFGRILNPFSDEGKMRESLAADVQSAGRQVSGIQASDAGQKLEHEIIGGKGTGLSHIASPDVLRHLAREAQEKTEAKLRTQLTPIPGRGGGEKPDKRPETPAPQKAPKVPQDVIDAAKAEVRKNGPHAANARKLLDQQNITVL